MAANKPERKPRSQSRSAKLADRPLEDVATSRKPIDPFFKRALTEIAREAGLTNGPTELQIQRSSLIDLLLTVPAGLSLVGTLLAFFRAINIIEFKGENDKFNKETFAAQLARVYLWYAGNSHIADFESILNVIIAARYPREVFNYAIQRGCPFEKVDNQAWLWQARNGLQDVVVVICEALPLERQYFNWLAFAPSDTQTWHKFVLKLIEEREWKLLDLVRLMRPKELNAMTPEVEKLLAQYGPEELARLEADWAEVIEDWLPKTVKRNPAQVAKVLSGLKPEERLSGLKPEERLSGLKPEERLSGLKPEERQALLKLLSEQTESDKQD